MWFCVAVAILATVSLLRGAVAIRATVFLLCCCGPCRSCSRKISGQEWVPMVCKRSEGVRGSREKRGQRKCWRIPSRLMVGRNGFANSVRGQMCGRGGVAGVATPTSRQGCGLSSSRQWQQGPENGQRAFRRRAERRIGSLKVRRQRLIRSFGPK